MHFVETAGARPTKAVFVDSIAGLSDPLSSMSSMFSLVSLLALTFNVRGPLPPGQDRLLTLMHTMSPATRSAEYGIASESLNGCSREEILNSFIRFLNPVLSGRAGMLDFVTATDAFSKPTDFRDFWTLEQCNLLRQFIESGAPLRRMEGYDIPFLESFVPDTSCRIALGKTKGMMLLVPGDAQAGDNVWWDDDEQRLIVSRSADDELLLDGEPFLDGGSLRAIPEIRSAN